MRYLSLLEVLELHRRIIEQSGGALSVRDLGMLESAVAQPLMMFGGEALYPSIVSTIVETTVEKAAAIGFSTIMNHPFVDGNKRTGHAAMEVFLAMNGVNISATTDEQERTIIAVASGDMKREAFTEWLRQHTIKTNGFASR